MVVSLEEKQNVRKALKLSMRLPNLIEGKRFLEFGVGAAEAGGDEEPGVFVIGLENMVEFLGLDIEVEDVSLPLGKTMADEMDLLFFVGDVDGKKLERFVVFGAFDGEADAAFCFDWAAEEFRDSARHVPV